MNAIIITIGDEILNGDTVDTNSGWLARELVEMGITIQQIISVGDVKEHILAAFDHAIKFADFVLVTGGLGPTNDDLTKECFAEFFDIKLKANEEFKRKISAYYQSRGRSLDDAPDKIFLLPESVRILENDYGVAPGMWKENNGKIMIALPGIPFEMKGIVKDQVIPLIRKEYALPKIKYHYFLTAGKGETVLAKRLADIEENLPKNLSISYLPSFSNVKVRLSAKGKSEALNGQFEQLVPEIRKRLEKEIYSEIRDDKIVNAIGKICDQLNITIGTAESCTGGNIAQEITSVPGSSLFFKGTVVAYANEVKENILGVSNDSLIKYGAVSEIVAQEMAKAAIEKLDVDYAVSTTGIAGPTGGTPEKPVGMVCMAVANRKKVRSKTINFTNKREKNIQLFTMSALNFLLTFIKEEHK